MSDLTTPSSPALTEVADPEDDLDEDVDLDEEDDDYDELVRAKWTIDGATTLAEAAEKARDFSIYLQSLHDEGWVLRNPIDDDYGFYYKPDLKEETCSPHEGV